jgi:glutamyl-tRNA synthetase
MREEQEKNSVKIGYDGRCENLTKEQIDEKIAAGIKPCIRLKMPKTGNIE